MPLPSFRFPLAESAPASCHCRSASLVDFVAAFADEIAAVDVVVHDDAAFQ